MTTSSFDYNTLLNLLAKAGPMPGNHGVWLVPEESEMAFKKMKDGEGQYLLQLLAPDGWSVRHYLFGRPLIFSPYPGDIAFLKVCPACGRFLEVDMTDRCRRCGKPIGSLVRRGKQL